MQLFFAFDGVDEPGKSTQIDLFCQHLEERGRRVVRCRDPGSTQLGEQLRELLLHSDQPRSVRAEMLIYMAARAQLVEEVIRPALQSGKTVVSDRFLLSNVAYQGHAGGLDPATVWEVGRAATAGLLPDLTFVLDLDAAAAAARLGTLDQIEARGDQFFQRVRQGMLDEAAADPQRIRVIDAAQDVQQVHETIVQAADPLLQEKPS